MVNSPTFLPALKAFKPTDISNQMPPTIFNFLSTFISSIANTYHNYPLDFDDNISFTNIAIKQVPLDNSARHDNHSKTSISNTPHKPCSLSVYKGFEAQHYPLNNRCGVKKVSSQEIQTIMETKRSYPTCAIAHSIYNHCVSTRRDGASKACSNGCIHNEHPLNYADCKHSDERPSITFSKVGSNKSIPIMETLETSPAPLDIQYDSGCQFSLISKSPLLLLPANTYSLANSARINLLDFTGQGQFDATEVKLNLYDLVLKLVVFDTNLDSRSTYSLSLSRQESFF